MQILLSVKLCMIDIKKIFLTQNLQILDLGRIVKGSFISFQLVQKLRTPIFHPLCNQKFEQIKILKFSIDKKAECFGLRKFLVVVRMKNRSTEFWH